MLVQAMYGPHIQLVMKLRGLLGIKQHRLKITLGIIYVAVGRQEVGYFGVNKHRIPTF